MRLIPPVVIGVLWVAWVITWLAAAAWSARPVVRQSRTDRWRHSLFVLAGAAMLFSHARGPIDRLHAPLVRLPQSVGWTAVMTVALGFAWTWWARIHLGKLWSGDVTLKPSHRIVRTGPYGFTRHPIYTGLLLALVGTAIADFSIGGFIGAGLVVMGLVIKIGQEERLLISHFGTAYEDFRREVPALVPGIW